MHKLDIYLKKSSILRTNSYWWNFDFQSEYYIFSLILFLSLQVFVRCLLAFVCKLADILFIPYLYAKFHYGNCSMLDKG